MANKEFTNQLRSLAPGESLIYLSKNGGRIRALLGYYKKAMNRDYKTKQVNSTTTSATRLK